VPGLKLSLCFLPPNSSTLRSPPCVERDPLHDRLAGPLTLASSDPLAMLPNHFPWFVLQALETITRRGVRTHNVELDRISLDDRGFLTLSGDDAKTRLNAIPALINAIRRQAAKEFPKEKIAWGSDSYAPKYRTWRPHVTIGRVFHRDGLHLPLPLQGKATSRRLTSPITFRIEQIGVVHYAYRSLLRCIGEFAAPLDKPVQMTPEQVARALQI
jgi:hypothetical protein